MRKLKTLLLMGAVALVALAASSATAGAFTVSNSPAGAIAAASLGALTFSGGATIRCPVTLNGSLLAGPITIAAGERIGSITEVRIGTCEGGSVRRVLVESGSAWPIQINSVPSGLPNSVSSVQILVVNSKFDLSTFGGFVECLYEGSAPASLAVSTTRTAGVYTTGLETVLTNSERFISGNNLCPSSGSFAGSFGLTRQTLTVS